MSPAIIYPEADTSALLKHIAEPAQMGFGTRLIHVGSEPDPVTGAVIPAMSLSTTFKQAAPGVYNGFDYSRSDNPNRRALETMLASIEADGAHALTFASGSAATASLLQSLGPGAHVLSVNDVYGGTFRYMHRVAREVQGLETTFADLERMDDADILAAIRPETKLIWVESPTNPTLRLIDVERLARLARSHPSKPLLLVDNTFLSPFYASPLRSGADIVLHSMTKYINGHSDVVMGALVFPSAQAYANEPERGARVHALFERARFVQNAFGAVPSAHDAWLLQRGAKTLHLRMRAHGLNALRLAAVLRSSPYVTSVSYPGLAPLPGESRAKYELARRVVLSSEGAARWLASQPDFETTLGGVPFGGVVSFRIRGDTEETRRFLSSLRLFSLAESLGGVESLAEAPVLMTHASIPPAQRAVLGIDGALIRLSVGVEDVEDLEADVLQALEFACAISVADSASGSSAEVSLAGSSVGVSLAGSSPASTSVESLPLKPVAA